MDEQLYALDALQHALVEELEDGTWFASVAALQGAWGSGNTANEAKAELEQSVYSWAVVRRERGLDLPPPGATGPDN